MTQQMIIQQKKRKTMPSKISQHFNNIIDLDQPCLQMAVVRIFQLNPEE